MLCGVGELPQKRAGGGVAPELALDVALAPEIIPESKQK